MAEYRGKEYVLVDNSPKPEVEADAIALGGKQYPLVRLSLNEFEYTEIIAIDGIG